MAGDEFERSIAESFQAMVGCNAVVDMGHFVAPSAIRMPEALLLYPVLRNSVVAWI